jgi:hypothetical protein
VSQHCRDSWTPSRSACHSTVEGTHTETRERLAHAEAQSSLSLARSPGERQATVNVSRPRPCTARCAGFDPSRRRLVTQRRGEGTWPPRSAEIPTRARAFPHSPTTFSFGSLLRHPFVMRRGSRVLIDLQSGCCALERDGPRNATLAKCLPASQLSRVGKLALDRGRLSR